MEFSSSTDSLVAECSTNDNQQNEQNNDQGEATAMTEATAAVSAATIPTSIITHKRTPPYHVIVQYMSGHARVKGT
jgi:hypothetical protein